MYTYMYLLFCIINLLVSLRIDFFLNIIIFIYMHFSSGVIYV